ncbi:MAG: response regulator receiver domain-containing protein [Desulfatitalea sp. BRH_c12]|nr:MAG: response regulator receiver domain-containing protein [Desulfatitalea sp. BRH_c12]
MTNSFHVLLVDDERDIRDVLQVALSDSGYTVSLAENGQQALALFRESSPPIVITDIKMPVMDGIELLQRIKRENPETEVIMITGHGDMDLAIKSLKYKAGDFITKPINVDALDITLQRTRERIVMRRKLQEYTTHLEALVREKSQLQDHLSSLGLMIGSISHGIKGLLTGLDGGIYLLGKGLKTGDEVQMEEGWQTVRLMAERIRKMVMDILFYAKKRDLQWEKVDLRHFVEEIGRIMENRLKDTGIMYVREFGGPWVDCTIDPGSVHIALINLFDNAIDACQRQTDRSDHRITFGVKSDATHITFTISDTGTGMDAETQDKLFTLFFSSKGRKGTGLGLYITQKIISQHGGTITVASTPGRGSRFTLVLPRSAADLEKAGA